STQGVDPERSRQVSERGRERHPRSQEARGKLQALDEKAQAGALTPEEAWQRARWTHEFEGDEAVLPLYQEILAAQPDFALAHFALGQLLLDREDESGFRHLERAMELDL